MLGNAKRVRIDKDNTTVIDGAGKKKDIEGRIAQIKAQVEDTTSDYDREEAAGTAGEAGRWCCHHQGQRFHRNRGQGAQGPGRGRMHATKALVEEGVVAGGGAALLVFDASSKARRAPATTSRSASEIASPDGALQARR